jgi:indole-3-glycerol phosphate synthase
MKAQGTYLEKILARTATEIAARKKQKPLATLKVFAKAAPRSPPFEQTLRRSLPHRIIGELKRKSPAQGFLDRDLDLAVTAREYTEGGTAAVAVHTEGPFFGGSLEDLARARQGAKLPVLRLDFIVDEYQLVESRVNGASAVNLVVAALEKKQLPELMKAARELEIEPVVEVHDAGDLDRALDAGAGLIAINNRELAKGTVDLGVTETLAPAASRSGALVLSYGGILTADDVRRAAAAGAEAFIIGEALLKAASRSQAVGVLKGA